MEYLIICSSAFLASGLTLFSGFGLGTLLMPIYALFFPVTVAISLTAIVHFLNNLFKLLLLGKYANSKIAFKFGLPAVLSASLGAVVLNMLSKMSPWIIYHLFSRDYSVTPLNLIMGFLIFIFVILDVFPIFRKIRFKEKYLPLGGILSGFFGGLSGHQGAFRSAFLIKCALSRESFIGTGVLIACFVDFSRMLVYRTQFFSVSVDGKLFLLIAATVSAFLGAMVGNRLMKKVTLRSIQLLISILLLGIAIGLGSGLLS